MSIQLNASGPKEKKEVDPHYEFKAKVVVERRYRLGGSCCVRDGWIAPGEFDIVHYMIINNTVIIYPSEVEDGRRVQKFVLMGLDSSFVLVS